MKDLLYVSYSSGRMEMETVIVLEESFYSLFVFFC